MFKTQKLINHIQILNNLENKIPDTTTLIYMTQRNTDK